jgi:hypothetical protein
MIPIHSNACTIFIFVFRHVILESSLNRAMPMEGKFLRERNRMRDGWVNAEGH